MAKKTTSSSRTSAPIPKLQDLRSDVEAHISTNQRIEELEHLARDKLLTDSREGRDSFCKLNNCNNHVKSKNVKAGRETTGGDDNGRVYVPWPQEFCYVGPTRVRIKFDDLTYPQLASGLLKIIENEPSERVRYNMTMFASSIFQDIVDYSYIPVRGALAVCLNAIEEGRASWLDFDRLLSMKKQYLLTSDSLAASQAPKSTFSNFNFKQSSSTNQNHVKQSSSSNQNQVRLCRNFNQRKIFVW